MFTEKQVEIVHKINKSSLMAYLAITGGGQTFIGDYLSISGGSNTIIGATVPYNQVIFDDFAGKVNKYCSPEAALALAKASYEKAKTVKQDNIIGIGVSCSLKKENERVGRKHEAYIAVYCDLFAGASTNCLYGQNEISSRQEQEAKVSGYILDVLDGIARFYGEQTIFTNGLWRLNLLSRHTLIKEAINFNKSPYLIYPGSFSILHEGHKKLAELSEEIIGAQVHFDISIYNADKGSINLYELVKRYLNINNINKQAITIPQALIKDKVEWLRDKGIKSDIIFVVGADLWTRIWDEKYGYSLQALRDFFQRSSVKFLVFGRNGLNINIPISEELRIKNDAAENFNMQISSTQLKNENQS